MKTKVLALLLALCMIVGMAACGNTGTPSGTAEPGEKAKAEMLAGDDLDEFGGADVDGAYDVADSKYFVNPDFYNMSSDAELTILANFKTFQQTTEWSCGPAAAVMALNYLGVQITELEAATVMKANTDEDVEGALPGTADSWYEPGANIAKLMALLETLPEIEVYETSYIAAPTPADLVTPDDVASLVYSPVMEGNIKKTFDSASLYASENDPATEAWVEDAADSYFVTWLTGHLKAGRPVLAHTSIWNGHFVVIIGYDNMGTPAIGDDMLILADPYDTYDHWQDGYAVLSLERFFYEWDDLNIAPKPYQLQQFAVIAVAE